MNSIVLIGGGGHSKVVQEILRLNRMQIYGIIDADASKTGYCFGDVKILGTDEMLPELLKSGVKNAIVTVGSVGDNRIRAALFKKICQMGFNPVNAVHPSVLLSEDAVMGQGNAIMPGAIINACTRIGNNVVLNSGCIIEHDTIIDDNVFIGPGAVVAGGVSIGEGSFIGLGAKIIQNIIIGRNVLVGAGAIVLDDIPDNAVVIGIPGKIKGFQMKKN